jgi:phosphoglycolate phosphatase
MAPALAPHSGRGRRRPPPPTGVGRQSTDRTVLSLNEALVTLPPVLAIDLDGTLVDTAPDLMSALNVVLAEAGLPAVPLEAAKGMIGAGARALLERGLNWVGADRTTKEIDRLFEAFFRHYTSHIADESRPFPGAIEAIDRFAAEGWRLAICTNKLEGMSRLLLEELGILDRFTAVSGGDSFPFKKPDPRHLRETIAAAGGEHGNAVMVGDSETDVQTAKAAGVPVIAVDFGYSTVPVSTLSPDRIISRFDELHDAVAAIRAAAVR